MGWFCPLRPNVRFLHNLDSSASEVGPAFRVEVRRSHSAPPLHLADGTIVRRGDRIGSSPQNGRVVALHAAGAAVNRGRPFEFDRKFACLSRYAGKARRPRLAERRAGVRGDDDSLPPVAQATRFEPDPVASPGRFVTGLPAPPSSPPCALLARFESAKRPSGMLSGSGSRARSADTLRPVAE